MSARSGSSLPPPEIAPGDLDESFYVTGTEAVQHFFRVAGQPGFHGVGEPQIRGPGESRLTGEATELTNAPAPSSTGWSTRLFPWPNGVRAKTGIGGHSRERQLCRHRLWPRKSFGIWPGKNVLLLGAGEWRNWPWSTSRARAPAKSLWPTGPWSGAWRWAAVPW